jgi:hypothetical protein
VVVVVVVVVVRIRDVTHGVPIHLPDRIGTLGTRNIESHGGKEV